MLQENQKEFISQEIKNSNFNIEKLCGDASSRNYFRVTAKNRSWVLMLREVFSEGSSLPFLNIQSFLKKNSIAVPEIINYDGSKGLILMEDLGDESLQSLCIKSNEEEIISYYKKSIDTAIQIQSINPNSSCVAFDLKFNTEKFLSEMNFAKTHLIKNLLQFSISESLEKELNKEFLDICQRLDEIPKKLCHRDYHSRNIMISKEKIRVIDFQDARLGPPEYDIVSLLQDSYANLNKETKNILKKYYLEKINHKEPERFLENYKIQTLQRGFKVCGSFASFFNLKQNKRYLQYLLMAVKSVYDEILPEYRGFKNLLEESQALATDYTKL